MNKSTTYVLKSIVKITEQKDIDSLEKAIFKTIIEMLKVIDITLFRIKNNNINETLNFHKDIINNEWQWCYHPNPIITDGVLKKIKLCNEAFTFRSKQHFGIAMPIKLNGKLISVISCISNNDTDTYKEALNYIIRIYQNYLEIFDESEKDTLTHLYNRKTFEQKLTKLLTNQQQKYQQIDIKHNEQRVHNSHFYPWIVMFDIDHFKLVNDKFGHVYGDEVLLTLSQLMKSCFRDNDLMFRFGGDEFVLILEPTSYVNTVKVLNKFRQIVATYEFPQVGFITISVGFCKATKDAFPITLIENADRALYFTKENGRNNVNNFENLISAGDLSTIIISSDPEFF